MDTPIATLSDEEWIALLDFRDRHGRTWAFDLWSAWTNGTDVSEPHGATLRRIRNTKGQSFVRGLTRPELERQRERFTLALRARY